MIPPHMWHLRVRSAPYFQNCISGFQALFSCSDSQNRFCKIPCTLQYGGANLPFSPLPSTFLAAIALLTVREFSQEQQWLTFKGGACELCLVTQDDVISSLEVRVFESKRVCVIILCWGYISCSLQFHLWCDCLYVDSVSHSPVSLSVRHLSVTLQHCAWLRDRNCDQGGQTVTINYTRAEAAITLALMPVTRYSLLKILGNGS